MHSPDHGIITSLRSQTSNGLPDHPPRLPRIGQVKATLNELSARKATGVDNIPAWVLKKFSDELAPVVHNIITTSITETKYPTLYKHALVSPIPKIQPPEDIEKDFRQISVIPVLGKVLEKVQISLNKSALTVTGNQHAFTQEPRGAQLCRLLSTSHRADSMTLTTARQAETASMHCFSTSARPLIWSIILSCCQS